MTGCSTMAAIRGEAGMRLGRRSHLDLLYHLHTLDPCRKTGREPAA